VPRPLFPVFWVGKKRSGYETTGHQPGNYEVPGLVPGFDSAGWDLSTAVASLGKKLYPHYLSYREYARGVVSRMRAHYGWKAYSVVLCFLVHLLGLLCCGLVNFIV